MKRSRGCTIENPDDLTEDGAVEFIIKQYKDMTGVELKVANVWAEMREQMGGRSAT